MKSNCTIVVCGAGIAGVATAYYLLKKRRDIRVVLIDKNQPLSFTTSKSGENFRDYWPQKNMRKFMSDSILLMKELREVHGENSFDMIHSGYDFVSHNIDNPIFGSGHQVSDNSSIEELTDVNYIHKNYPYLDPNVEKIVKIKNAGKIDVYGMGSLLLREAKNRGLEQIQGEILSIEKKESSFKVLLDSKESIRADKIIIAAGPFLNEIAGMLDIEFPITNTLQRKIIIPDPDGIVPRDMPFTIYADAQYLDWSKEEVDFFSSEEKYEWLLKRFPGGLHIKPEGESIKLGWAFQTEQLNPTWETPKFDLFPQVILKGASRFIPGIASYENSIPTPIIEYAGYYTRTDENWPLIGNTELDNVFVVGALAGYGTMGACAAGNLCSNYVLDIPELPDYAPYFSPMRYQNEIIKKEMSEIITDGQL